MFLKKIISICILRKVYVRENSLNKFASAKLMESVSLKDNLQKALETPPRGCFLRLQVTQIYLWKECDYFLVL